MDEFLKRVAEAMERQAVALEAIAEGNHRGSPGGTSSETTQDTTPEPEKPVENDEKEPEDAPSAAEKKAADRKKKAADAAAAKEKAKAEKAAAASLAKFKKAIIDIAKKSKLSDHLPQLREFIRNYDGGQWEISDEIPAEERAAFVEAIQAHFDNLVGMADDPSDI